MKKNLLIVLIYLFVLEASAQSISPKPIFMADLAMVEVVKPSTYEYVNPGGAIDVVIRVSNANILRVSTKVDGNMKGDIKAVKNGNVTTYTYTFIPKSNYFTDLLFTVVYLHEGKEKTLSITKKVYINASVIKSFKCTRYGLEIDVDDSEVIGYYLVVDKPQNAVFDVRDWVPSKPTSIPTSILSDSFRDHVLTLYVKQTNGNITSASANYYCEQTAPLVSLQCISATNQNVVPLNIFVYEKGSGIAGYYLRGGNSTQTWVATQPKTITLTTEGTNYLSLSVKDNAGNISELAIATVLLDKTAPNANLFCRRFSNVIVPVTISAYETGSGIAGYYLIADNSIQPALEAKGWVATAPKTITLTTEGEHWLYLWVKDKVGNISKVSSANVLIDKTAPVVSLKCASVTVTNIVPLMINVGEVGSGIDGYYLSVDNITEPEVGSEVWKTNKPETITLKTVGEHGIFLWVKDKAGNVGRSMATVSYNKRKEGPGDKDYTIYGIVPVSTTAAENGNGIVSEASKLQFNKTSSLKVATLSSASITDNTLKDVAGNISRGTNVSLTYTSLAITNQTIPIAKGWNLISFNVIPNDINLSSVFATSISSGSLVKVIDQYGKTFENFGVFGGWKNSIGTITPSQGYKVYAKTAFTLSLTGSQVSLPMEIPLKKGLNIISFPSQTEQSCSSVFSLLIAKGLLQSVADVSGKTMENWGARNGGWKNNIGNLKPNQGYLVSVNRDCTLTIDSYGLKGTEQTPDFITGNYFSPVYEGHGFYHMSLHVTDLLLTGLEPGDELGVFDGAICVGSSTITASDLEFNRLSIICSADDGLLESADGFGEGHNLKMKVYKGGKEYDVQPDYISGKAIFKEAGSAIVSIKENSITESALLLDNKPEVRIYPNPFNNDVTINLSTTRDEDIDVRIVDINGKTICRLFQGAVNSSTLALQWDGKDDRHVRVSPGIYFCRVNKEVVKLIKTN